jgi:hypothetical protein
VSYNSEQNTTTYETRTYTVSGASSENYGRSKSIDLRAVACCQGPNCSPGIVQLVFSVSGGEELAISGAGGTITADGSTINWTIAEAGEAFS